LFGIPPIIFKLNHIYAKVVAKQKVDAFIESKKFWFEWVGYVDGWIAKFAFFVPVIGYLLLFNDYIIKKFSLEEFAPSADCAFLCFTGPQRLELIYFGLIFLGLSNVLYRIRRPAAFEFGDNTTEYIRTCFDVFTYTQYLNMNDFLSKNRPLTSNGEYRVEDWDNFSKTVLGEHDNGHVDSYENWDGSKSKFGNLLRSMLIENFHLVNQLRLKSLVLCVVLSTIGYVLLVIPSVDIFVRVLANTIWL